MDFRIKLNGAVHPTYPVRVGFSCRNGDSYAYPYSQLSYTDSSNKNMIEDIDGAFQSIAGFSTNPDTLEQKWKPSSSDITYSDSSTGMPTYAHRGIFVFVIKSISSHPVLSCNSWLNSADAISDTSSSHKCPGTRSQMTHLLYASTTVGDYTFYFIPASAGSAEGRMCGYLDGNSSDAGSLFPPVNHAVVEGANIYRYLLF